MCLQLLRMLETGIGIALDRGEWWYRQKREGIEKWREKKISLKKIAASSRERKKKGIKSVIETEDSP